MNMMRIPTSGNSLRSLLIGSRRVTGGKLIKLKIVYGTTAYKKGDIMKRFGFVFTFIMLNLVYAFCGGIQDKRLVNVQEIELNHFDEIEIQYRSEEVVIFSNNSEEFILKEYMTENNSGYYAKIINSGNKLIVEAGQRPVRLFNLFGARIEVYIPISNKNITIKTSSGSIKAAGEYNASLMVIESSSGNISVNSITADIINFKTSSGSINCQNANGNSTIETSSGSIVCSIINSDLFIKSSSGNIHCITNENAKDIKITTSSGSVILDIPKNFSFNFSSRSSSGSLNTPFSDKLFSPVSDKNYIQGVIDRNNTSENQITNNISIRTSSGSIRANWID